MHGNVKDILGKRFSRLTVIARAGSDNGGSAKWLCKCVCGMKRIIYSHSLVSGKTKSCGCLSKEVTGAMNRSHEMYGTPVWRSWQSMKSRCNNKKLKSYKDYGGRGITFCTRWDKFENFIADMGPRPSLNYSIDRIDNDGNYEPSNCRWATRQQQTRNKRIGKNNKSGIIGVYRAAKSWRAVIKFSGNRLSLYQGPDFFEACCARKNAELRYWT